MRSPSCRRGKQSGYVLVLSVILLGLFLSLAAAAIDMGNLYVWQLRLDKAVRAGALAGLGYRSMHGWQVVYGGEPDYQSPTKTAQPRTQMAELLSVAETAVKDNFKMSFPGSLTDWQGVTETVASKLKPLSSSGTPAASLIAAAPNAYNPVQDKITLTYQYEVPTFFAGRLKGVLGGFPMCNSSNGSGCVITSEQSAQLDYANIVMLLDVSGSIAQSNDTQNLIAAATSFYKLFNPFRDRISVIQFNLGARVAFGFQNQSMNVDDPPNFKASFGRDQETWNTFKTSITSITPQSNTNPCDALINAIDELNWLAGQRRVAGSVIRPFVVFFTDGAPNAFRGNFQNMTNLSTGGNPAPSGDWYQYALEWAVPGRTYQGPSPLIKASSSLFNLTPTATMNYNRTQCFQQPNTPDYCDFSQGNEYCGDIWSSDDTNSPDYFERALNGGLGAGARRLGCLTDLDFSIPNGDQNRVISVRAAALGDADPFKHNNQQKFSELPYYCAIEAADQIRERYRGTVFAIGLGPTSNTRECNDPLQNPTDHFTRKDNFLSRLAFDPFTYQAGSWKGAFNVSGRRDANFNSSCTPTSRSLVGYDLISNGTNAPRTPAELSGTEGQYYPTPESTDLPFLFAQVAKQILLRLNS